VSAAQRLFSLVGADRRRVSEHKTATVTAVRLFEHLPEHPMITLAKAVELVGATKPTTGKAIDALNQAGILKEITGRKRDRIYAYQAYLDVLAEDTHTTPG
jgi:Fic family protein